MGSMVTLGSIGVSITGEAGAGARPDQSVLIELELTGRAGPRSGDFPDFRDDHSFEVTGRKM